MVSARAYYGREVVEAGLADSIFAGSFWKVWIVLCISREQKV